MKKAQFHDAEDGRRRSRCAAGSDTSEGSSRDMSTIEGVSGLRISGARQNRQEEVLTAQALELIARLHRELNARRIDLLAARQERLRALAAGDTLRFLPETAHIRDDDSWRVAEPAPGLVDRRAEITGPTDRKMTINALNSGAKVWLADHEDANTPLWENVIGGQLNLKDALDRTIDFSSPEGKSYTLRPDEELPTIVVRPRGWHLPEKHITVDGEPASGSLVDFALYLATSRSEADRPRARPVLLPAEDGEPPRGAALDRRLQPGPGLPRHATRHHPRDRADRDLPG